MNFQPDGKTKRGHRFGGELTPMIDVVFLLLVFFLVSTSQAPPESELSPSLEARRVEGGRSADFQPQVVDVLLIAGRPAFQLGERTLRTQAELTELLRALPAEAGVFVRGRGDAPTSAAAAALQAAHDAGFGGVTYVPAN
ncbi:MAG: biopolymer transporter ExbD [Planctomycetota bacterium]